MKSFEQLQAEKSQRAEKLLELLPQLAVAEMSGADVKSGMSTLSDNLKSLLTKIKEQKALSSDEQRNSLLDEEILALDSRHKELGTTVISHVERVSKGAELNVAPVREALILIASRKDSLSKL